MTRLLTPHTWSHLFDIDISRLNPHQRLLGWRMMSQYPHGFRLSILRECLSLLFHHQSTQIQQFTLSKRKTLWVRLHLILKSESQVRMFNRVLILQWRKGVLLKANFMWLLFWTDTKAYCLTILRSLNKNSFHSVSSLCLMRVNYFIYQCWTTLIEYQLASSMPMRHQCNGNLMSNRNYKF